MRPPNAKSSQQNEIMGKVARSPYSKETMPRQPAEHRGQPVNKALLYVAVAAVGAVAVMLLRQRQAPATQTGPLVVLSDAVPPEQSQIDNLTQAVLALAAQSQNGGATTPQTPAPNS